MIQTERATWSDLLANRSFLALWMSRSLSGVGEWVGQVALMALVFRLTDSALAVAVLQSLHAVPVLVLAPVVGVLVDRWDRKTILALSHLGRGLLFLSLAFVDDLPRIFVIYLGVNLAMLFFVPATSAMLPSIVTRSQLVSANSLTSTTSNIAMIFGASLGGAIIAWLGIPAALAVDGLCCIAASGLITLVQVPLSRGEGRTTLGFVIQQLVAGSHYTTQNRLVGMVIGMNALMAMGSGAINVLAIVFAGRVLGGGSSEYSLLLTACGVGSLVGSMLLFGLGVRIQPQRMFNLGFGVLALAIVAIALSRNAPLAAAAYFAAGLGQVAATIVANVMVQAASSDEYLGRVFGLMQMVRHGAWFLALAAVGWSAEVMPVETVLLASGLAMLAGAGLSARLVR